MAITYQRNTWETGKVITAKALNDIETGIVNIVEKLNNMDSQVESQALTVEGEAKFNGPVEIKGATTVKNNITVDSGNYIILSENPSENKHAVTKEYVDGKTINSVNDGITATGTLGSGISIELKPASSTALGGIKVGDKLSFTDNILNLPVASALVLGGIKVGTNLSINDQGVLSATDTTYALASTTADGLMSKDDFEKLKGIPANATSNKGTITGIKIDENTTIESSSITENGIIDISGHVLTEHQDITGKADTANPSFTGTASFGNNIKIKSSDHTIAIGSAVLSETQLNSLYSILPQNDISDGDYTLKLSKSTVDNEPVFTYTWVSVSQQESGGEGS